MSKAIQKELKGLAIICLMMLHFWGHPEWIHQFIPSYEFESILPNEVYYSLGGFGNVCVSMFAFITGYGFNICKDKYNSLKYRSIKAFCFLSLYWMYEIIFLFVGYIIGSEIPSVSVLLCNLLGFKAEVGFQYACIPFAWYTWLYLLILMLYPIIGRIGELSVSKVIAVSLLPYIFTYLILIRFGDGPVWVTAARMCTVSCSVIGYMFAEQCNYRYWVGGSKGLLIGAILVLITAVIRWLNLSLFIGLYGVIYSVLIIWLYCLIQNMNYNLKVLRPVRFILGKLGENGTGMWFISGIFFLSPGSLYKYGYISKNPWIVLIWVIVISFLIALLIDRLIYQKIDQFLRKKVL